MYKWLCLVVVLFVLIGCGNATKPPTPVQFPTGADQVVFQIDTAGGFVPPIEWEAHVPELTVFGDGRVLFVRQDQAGVRRVLETRLEAAKLSQLMRQADQAMTGLKESYEFGGVADASTTRFALQTAAGKRSTSVYAFGMDPAQRGRDQEDLAKLTALRSAFTAVLPDQAPVHTPDSVEIIAETVPPGEYSVPQLDWPAGLPDLPDAAGPNEMVRKTYTGNDARKLVQQVPYRSMGLYRFRNNLYFVAVKPAVPLLR